MLEFKTKEKELFDENTEEFVTIPSVVLLLEHSLVSIYKWEEEIKKPFLSQTDKTRDEMTFYVQCMTISPKKVPQNVYKYLDDDEIKTIFDYVKEERTATTVKTNGKRSSEVITNELVYFWMFSYQIPKECEQWHFSRLLKLIEVFSVKNQPTKKMPRQEHLSKMAAINRARRAKYGTKG